LKDTKPYISICILSYNRPKFLKELINSIDLIDSSLYEILINDDCSPRLREIETVIKSFKTKPCIFYKNIKNKGYDKSLINLVEKTSGEWIIFMGDDDLFIPGALPKVIEFLKHNNIGYMLKSHVLIHDKNRRENFRYYNHNKFFSKGFNSYIELFRKSVFISGFTIKSKIAKKYITNRFKNTLLTQLYLLAETCMNYPTAYFDEPFTIQNSNKEHDKKDYMYDLYGKKIDRKPTIQMSIDFLNSFSIISNYIDSKYKINSTKKIKENMSKYFYPSLSVHREEGFFHFLKYVYELNKNGFGITFYYYVYVIGLILLNKKGCDFIVYFLKKIIGYTPKL
jgi:abequosyltransferase